MFFDYAEELVYRTKQLPVIWEIEVAIAAILVEALESADAIQFKGLEAEMRELLLSRISCANPLLNEVQAELSFVLRTNASLLQGILRRMGSVEEKRRLRRELDPNREKILAAIQHDSGFEKFLTGVAH